MVGFWGTVAAVTPDEADEDGLVPAALVAVTVNVYEEPAVRPEVMVQVALADEQVAPPGLAVTR
jgi:hypothetical protein